jgi:hypothetical protein
MAEVVRHEHVDHTDGSGFGFLLGAVLIVALLAIIFFWGVPKLGGGAQTINQTNTPSQGIPSDVNINVPQTPTK